MHDSAGEFSPGCFNIKSVFLKDRATGRTDSPRKGEVNNKI